MNKNVETTCGKVQVKGKEGLRGMSLPEIEKLIMGAVKGTDKEGEFKRFKTSIPKGASKRIRYCAFIKENLKSEWNKYNKGKKPVNAPMKKAPAPKAIMELLGNGNGMNFAFEGEEAMEMGNVNNSEEREGGNYANNNNGRMVFQPTTFARGRRGGDKDPFKNIMNKKDKREKVSTRLKAYVRARLKAMKKAGQPVPEFKTLDDQYKFVMLMNPGSFTRKPMKRVLKSDIRTRVKRMSMPRGLSTVATGRVAKGPSVVKPVPGTKLSMPEIRTASTRADVLTNKLLKVGQNRNFMKEVIRKNAPADVNRLTKSLSALEKFNRNSIRDVIRTYELNRAKVLKNLGAPIAKAAPKNLPTVFGGVVPVTITELAREARTKKVANRTAGEKRALKVMEARAKMRAAGKRPAKPMGMKMMETTRPLNLVSNRNSNSNSNSVTSSVRSVRMMGSNSNSNSNSNNGLNQPIVKMVDDKMMINNTNVNKMNKSRLQRAARRVLAVVRPGTETGVWLNATNDELRRLVKASAKKMSTKSK